MSRYKFFVSVFDTDIEHNINVRRKYKEKTMFLELILGYWALKPVAEEIDRFSYEQQLLQSEIEDLKEEIEELKSNGKND